MALLAVIKIGYIARLILNVLSPIFYQDIWRNDGQSHSKSGSLVVPTHEVI